MPTLAPPAPSLALPRIAAPPAPRETRPAAAFGRTLADYVQFFALDLAALRGRDVLDVGAGAASFVAEACARRIDAVGVDPLYGEPPEVVAARVAAPGSGTGLLTRERPAPGREPRAARVTPDVHEASAAQRFLADYETHFIHGRYVGGSLPRLPFFDGTFDLVLCGHVLFAAGAFDFEWHLAAARELVRVSAGEVRLHPLGDAGGRPHPKLAALRRELKAGGIASEIRTPGGALPAGSRSMLVLRRAAP